VTFSKETLEQLALGDDTATCFYLGLRNAAAGVISHFFFDSESGEYYKLVEMFDFKGVCELSTKLVSSKLEVLVELASVSRIVRILEDLMSEEDACELLGG